MASKFLVEIEPTIHRTPNPITFKTGLKIPNKKMCAVPTTDAVNIPNELCSEKYKLIERQNQLKRVLSATHQADHGYVTSNVLGEFICTIQNINTLYKICWKRQINQS